MHDQLDQPVQVPHQVQLSAIEVFSALCKRLGAPLPCAFVGTPEIGSFENGWNFVIGTYVARDHRVLDVRAAWSSIAGDFLKIKQSSIAGDFLKIKQVGETQTKKSRRALPATLIASDDFMAISAALIRAFANAMTHAQSDWGSASQSEAMNAAFDMAKVHGWDGQFDNDFSEWAYKATDEEILAGGLDHALRAIGAVQ